MTILPKRKTESWPPALPPTTDTRSAVGDKGQELIAAARDWPLPFSQGRSLSLSATFPCSYEYIFQWVLNKPLRSRIYQLNTQAPGQTSGPAPVLVKTLWVDLRTRTPPCPWTVGGWLHRWQADPRPQRRAVGAAVDKAQVPGHSGPSLEEKGLEHTHIGQALSSARRSRPSQRKGSRASTCLGPKW